MTCTTIIINGFARAGKDTFVDACQMLMNQTKWVYAFSSIDPVRSLLRDLAKVDISKKTDADRKLMAEVGAALEAHSNWRTDKCVDWVAGKAAWAQHNSRDTVLFLHIREPENIAKVSAQIADRCLGVVHTLLLRSPREIMPDNVADNAVLGMEYEDTIHNDSGLAALSDKAHAYLIKKGLA